MLMLLLMSSCVWGCVYVLYTYFAFFLLCFGKGENTTPKMLWIFAVWFMEIAFLALSRHYCLMLLNSSNLITATLGQCFCTYRIKECQVVSSSEAKHIPIYFRQSLIASQLTWLYVFGTVGKNWTRHFILLQQTLKWRIQMLEN